MTTTSYFPPEYESQGGFTPTPYTARIREMIYQACGIYTPDNRLRFLEERCRRRMTAVHLESVRDYFEYLTADIAGPVELKSLLNEVTVGETCLFRNQPQLTALQEQILPVILGNKANQPLHHLRIWSAGCSTGEEAYTLAILVLEASVTFLKGWTFEVIATDLNEHSLVKAQEGIYGGYALRNVRAYYLDKYFQRRGESWQVRDNVRSLVRFSRVNLLDDGRMVFLKAMDVIFCCNVLIYFDSASKRRVVQHFYNNLLPNSYLFLGHSESLFGISSDFKLLHFQGATAYLKLPRTQLWSQP